MKGFTVKNWKNLKPREDSYTFDLGGIMAVADGITRDPIGIPILPNKKNIFGLARFLLYYPSPSGAARAADIFCEIFLKSMFDFNEKNSKTIYLSIINANEEICRLNQQWNPNPNYLENDYWACVAAGASINKSLMSYGFIADCGICIFDKHGEISFKTPNEGPNSKGSIDKDILKRFNTSFIYPVGRKIIRANYRNNPSEPLSYGALTGEEKALSYIKTGDIELKRCDRVFVYSDGLEGIITSPEFARAVARRNYNQIYRLCKKQVRTEGTLVTNTD